MPGLSFQIYVRLQSTQHIRYTLSELATDGRVANIITLELHVSICNHAADFRSDPQNSTELFTFCERSIERRACRGNGSATTSVATSAGRWKLSDPGPLSAILCND